MLRIGSNSPALALARRGVRRAKLVDQPSYARDPTLLHMLALQNRFHRIDVLTPRPLRGSNRPKPRCARPPRRNPCAGPDQSFRELMPVAKLRIAHGGCPELLPSCVVRHKPREPSPLRVFRSALRNAALASSQVATPRAMLSMSVLNAITRPCFPSCKKQFYNVSLQGSLLK